MRPLSSRDFQEMGLLKHYRIVRKWACHNNDISDAEIELLIYFDCLKTFRKHDYEIGVLTYAWNNRRWNKLLKNGWIVVWRTGGRKDQKYAIYELSFKCKHLIRQMYRIMLGEEDIPTSVRRNKLYKRDTYTAKVMSTAMDIVNKDKTR